MSTKTGRRAWPMWAIAAVFMVAIASVPLLYRHPVDYWIPSNVADRQEEWNLYSISAKIQEANLSLFVMPLENGGGIKNGFYVSTKTISCSEAEKLTSSKHPYEWHSIAICRNKSKDDKNFYGSPDKGYNLNDCTFLGDPILLKLIFGLLLPDTDMQFLHQLRYMLDTKL